MFEFYSLKLENVWILHLEISEFKGVKSKHPQNLEGKIKILKRRCVKAKHLQTSGGKI